MSTKLIISFIPGASGRFIASIINYVLYDGDVNVIDSRGSAHNDVSDLKNGWWLHNLDFLRGYHDRFFNEISESKSPHTIIQESLRHAYLNGSNKEVIEIFAQNYSAGTAIIKTHCNSSQLIKGIASIHTILPLVLLVDIETEKQYTHCNELSRFKSGRLGARNTGAKMSFLEYSTLTRLWDDKALIKFPIRHILNHDVDSTMNMFVDVITQLNSKISDEKLIVIRQEIIKYFAAQPVDFY